LGFDFITPHKHKNDSALDPFTDPKPIKFLKILPGVQFRFQFGFKPGLLTIEEKKTLMYVILTEVGIGAKTNVGYGQFVKPEPPKVFEEGQEVEGEIIEIRPDGRWVRVRVEEANWEGERPYKEGIFRLLYQGDTHKFTVSKINPDGSIKSVRLIPPTQNQNRSKKKR
jgi:hypothetical protein